MLRCSQTLLRVSPFALFIQELTTAGKLKRTNGICAQAARAYRKLSPAEKSALKRRAEVKTFPAQAAYQRLVKREMKSLSGMPLTKRQELIKKKWESVKKAQASNRSKVVPSAKKKVRTVSKTAKTISKGTGR